MDPTQTTAPEPPLDVVEAGAREAARAVARLVKSVGFVVDSVERLSVAELAARHAPRALVVGFSISGGLRGRFALITSEPHARSLARALVGGLVDDVFSMKQLGALTELGNIGASAYLNGVAAVLQKTCLPSVPALVLDDAAKAVESALGGPSPIWVARLDLGAQIVDLALTGI